MPCRYDPSPQEIKEMQDEDNKRLLAPYIKKLDDLTKLLCKACQIILQHDGECIYNAQLDIWYNKHNKLDKEREAIETEKKRLKKLEKTALSKLTEEEKQVLGLNL